MNGTASDNEYYALLNLPREAAPEDIKAAYRRLVAIFHPDKASSSDPLLQEVAAANFLRLQEAYEVLSDPQTRSLYDSYGKDGLKTGMELMKRTMGSEVRVFALSSIPSPRHRARPDPNSLFPSRHAPSNA